MSVRLSVRSEFRCKKTLLYLFLSLVQNEEPDEDIWYTYINTIIEILKENTEECGETAVVYNFIANDRNSLLHSRILLYHI